MRIYYSIDNENNVTLGNIEEVHVTYETVKKEEPESSAPTFEGNTGVTDPELTATATENNSTSVESTTTADLVDTTVSTNCSAENEPVAPVETQSVETSVNTTVDDAAANAANENTADFAAQNVDANTQTTTKEVGAVNEQNKETISSSAPLTDSERAEFEALKRAQKEDLLASYKEYLSEEEYNGFFATIDSVSKEELETSLLKAYKDFQERENAKPVNRIFSLSDLIGQNITKKSGTKESELADYIGELLHR